MVLGWVLLLVMALPTVMTGAMDCIFCELTDSSNYPGIPMTCGDDKECFMGKGMAPGLGPIINKGTMDISLYGRLEEPVTYQGITYSLTFTCHYGELCNRAPTPAGSLKAAATCLALGVLLLLLH
ncbi:PREDICTED: sperm acrosome membrane-associated protein 4-like [Myotis brandtii]|uniref:sperm acrosome membrane-associated protein 4-like n=1 Tax=Myotis brandtii TaxID=109478 RepID=UPI0003BBE9AB|nr:PREDICTED: sperm acrosome membrane-associated protein 4-like [Myotis brandtii]